MTGGIATLGETTTAFTTDASVVVCSGLLVFSGEGDFPPNQGTLKSESIKEVIFEGMSFESNPFGVGSALVLFSTTLL